MLTSRDKEINDVKQTFANRQTMQEIEQVSVFGDLTVDFSNSHVDSSLLR